MNALAPILEKDVWLHTQFHREGNQLVMTGYLVAGTKSRIFELKIDLRKVLALVMRVHQQLHDQMVAGENEIEIGRKKRRHRRRKGFFRKLGRKLGKVAKVVAKGGIVTSAPLALLASKKNRRALMRTAKKVAKSRLVRTAAKVVKSTAKKAIQNPVFRHGLKAMSVAMPALAPAAVAVEAAHQVMKHQKALGSLGRVLPIKPGTFKSIASASKHLNLVTKKSHKKRTKIQKFAKKLEMKARAGLVLRARRRGLAKKHDPRKLGRAIDKAAKTYAAKRIGKVLSKAPQLRRQLQVEAKAPNRSKQAIRKIIENSKHDPRAFKARQVLRSVALHNSRVQQIDTGRPQQGVTGLVVDDFGRVRRGRFVRSSAGRGTSDVIFTKQGIQPGHFQRVSGDCVGCAPCVGGNCGPVAGESVGECVGCGMGYPMGPVMVMK